MKEKKGKYKFLSEEQSQFLQDQFLQERKSLRQLRKERDLYKREKREEWKETHPIQSNIKKFMVQPIKTQPIIKRKITINEFKVNPKKTDFLWGKGWWK